MKLESLINVGIFSYNMEEKESRIAELFFQQPMAKFHVRQIGRLANLDTKTVMKYLNKLSRGEIAIRKKGKGRFPHYEANRLSPVYRYEKSHAAIKSIYGSGLVGYIRKMLHPRAIVLFGSMRKGTYHKDSDIDIFIQGERARIELSSFERKLKRKIDLLFESQPNRLSKGLLQNIYNGYVLDGEIEL